MNSTLQSIPISSIHIKPQVRQTMSQEDQTSLAQSIEHNGVLVPLLGYLERSEIILVDGHRRLDAAKRVGLDCVPMIVSDHIPSPSERITFQLLSNAHRRDLDITDHARAIQQLMHETQWSAAQVSMQLGGPSPATISKLLALLVLPKAVQDLIDSGKLPMSSAYTIATVTDSVERDRLVKEVLGGRMTRDRLVKHVKANRSSKKASCKIKRKRTPKERITIQLGQGRVVVVSAPSMTTEQITSWLVDLAVQLKDANKENRSREEVLKIVSDANKEINTEDPLPDGEDS